MLGILRNMLLVLIFFSLFRLNALAIINYSSIKQSAYRVTGTITNTRDGWIYLAHGETLNVNMRVDSARIVNGRFIFEGSVSGIQPFILGLPARDKNGREMLRSIIYKGPMILSNGSLSIEGDYHKPFKAFGTEAQNEFNIFNANIKKVDDKLTNIRLNLSKIKKVEIKKKDSLNAAYVIVSEQRLKVIEDHVNKYKDSEVSAYIAKKELINADGTSLRALYNLLTVDVQKTEMGRKLMERIVEASATDLGSLAPLFSLSDNKGNIVSLNSFKGNYVLVDFWASWCRPCREEHPNLIEVYGAFKDKGLKIIGISLDTRKDPWLKAVSEDNLSWTQLNDQKGMNSEVSKSYGIKVIPMNFLIDKSGKIIGRNLRGKELWNKLNQIF